MQQRLVMTAAMVIMLTACGDPIVMLPGGELSGELTRAPAEWTAVPEEVQLEFRPGKDPYSINIWAVAIDRDLYVATGADGTRWTEMLANDPAVRLRIDKRLYELLAVPVDDTEELLRVRQRYIDKYDIEPDSSMLDDAMVFRLDR